MEIYKSRLTKLGVVLVLAAAVLVAVWVVLLFLLGTNANRLIHLLPIAAAAFVAVAFWKRRSKSRIKYLSNNQTTYIAEADVRLCYGCRSELKPDQPKARCSVTATHEVHAACADVLQGKCPQCGNALEPGKEQAPSLNPKSEDIQVRVHTQGGVSHLINVHPDDLTSDDFIEELTQDLKLPHVDDELHPIMWALDDKTTGKTLLGNRTLAESGVRTGHDLHLRREVIAGGRAIQHVQLSVHYPPKVVPNDWFSLLTYVHIPEAMSVVQKQTNERLGRQISEGYLRTSANATRDISRGAEITVIPTLSGCTIKPERAKFLWLEDWHCEEFRFKSIAQVGSQLLTGQVSFYVGPILICEIAVVMRLSASVDVYVNGVVKEATTTTSRPYQSIFVSYAHDDSVIVQELEKAYAALGMEYFRDINILRSGEKWNPALLSKIEEADIFQLCWSHAAKSSKYVKREWKHAVGLNREYFLRPVYWQNPMPEPPPELADIHFAHLDV